MTEPNFKYIVDAIESYRQDTLAKPFFVAVDEVTLYHDARNVLAAKNGTEIRLSDFCRINEAEPDFDALLTKLREVTGFTVLIGLGEYLALAGRDKTRTELSRVKDVPLVAGAKVVVILRGCRNALERFCEDPRFEER